MHPEHVLCVGCGLVKPGLWVRPPGNCRSHPPAISAEASLTRMVSSHLFSNQRTFHYYLFTHFLAPYVFFLYFLNSQVSDPDFWTLPQLALSIVSRSLLPAQPITFADPYSCLCWPLTYILTLPNWDILTTVDLWSHWSQTTKLALASGFNSILDHFFLFWLWYLLLFSGLHTPHSQPPKNKHETPGCFTTLLLKWHKGLDFGSFGSQNIFVFYFSSRLIIRKLDLVLL